LAYCEPSSSSLSPSAKRHDDDDDDDDGFDDGKGRAKVKGEFLPLETAKLSTLLVNEDVPNRKHNA